MPVEIKCQTCGNLFEISNSDYKRGRGKYCSPQCQHKGSRKRVTKTCLNCGKSFEVLNSLVKKGWGKYCSRECSGKGRTKKINKKCLICGKPFKVVPARRDAKYCSQKCYFEAQKAKEPVKLICKHCNKSFYVPLWRAEENPKYCSIKCARTPKPQNQIIRKCENCGNNFIVTPSLLKHTAAKFCSRKCHYEFQDKKVERTCIVCGKVFKVSPSALERSGAIYCSRKCQNKNQVGPNASAWKGGISFEPYCSKFNEEFKERVREFWGRKCGISGITEKENGKKLSVHHVNYNKMVCCDNTPPLFIPLSKSLHPKTNNNREYWEYMLTEYIMIWFNGESYLPNSAK